MTTLGQLQVGDRARVVGFTDTGRGYRRKLLAMGLTPGAELEITRVAALSGTVEIRVCGCALSLRKEESAAIDVVKL